MSKVSELTASRGKLFHRLIMSLLPPGKTEEQYSKYCSCIINVEHIHLKEPSELIEIRAQSQNPIQ